MALQASDFVACIISTPSQWCTVSGSNNPSFWIQQKTLPSWTIDVRFLTSKYALHRTEIQSNLKQLQILLTSDCRSWSKKMCFNFMKPDDRTFLEKVIKSVFLMSFTFLRFQLSISSRHFSPLRFILNLILTMKRE